MSLNTYKLTNITLYKVAQLVKRKQVQWPQLVLPETHDSLRQVEDIDDQPISVYFATAVSYSPSSPQSSFCCKCNAFFIPTPSVGLRVLCCCLLVQIPCVGAHFSLQGTELACFGTWAVRRAEGAFLRLLRLLMIGRKREAPFTNALILRRLCMCRLFTHDIVTEESKTFASEL